MHRFQAILDSDQPAQSPWDRPLFESRSFIALPSLGSLVAGWVLVIPRRPALNLRDLLPHEKRELAAFASEVTQSLKPFGGDVFQFEHGNTVAGGLVGCGVDQAHLHLVPLDFDLISAAVETVDPAIEWQARTYCPNFAASIPDAGEYVAIRNAESGQSVTGQMMHPRSQWLRRVIANRLGRQTLWDYKANPNVENISQTISILQRA